MKIDWSFPLQVLIALIVVAVIAWYPLSTYASPEILKGSIAGAIMATLNVLLGYASIEYSIGKSTTTFFKFVLGGMGIRLFAMGIALVVLIKFLQIHAAALVSSLGIFYVVFLTLELVFIQKKLGLKHQS